MLTDASHTVGGTSAAASGRGRVRLVALLAPYALAAVLATLMRTALVSPLAPALGPWAGLAYGHSDCTLGVTAPTLGIALVAAGIGCGALLLFARGRWRSAARALLAVWAIAWELSALASIANTLS